MSAFIVGKDHIDLLVTAALHGPGDERTVSPGNTWQRLVRFGEADALGAMLIGENIASVSYRYGGESLETLPGPLDTAELVTYSWQATPRLPAAALLKAISCYEYQSCEHDAWETSKAKQFCSALRHALISTLPGYSDAPTWEYCRDTAR
jgi:hypothetical protein